jgi:tRNA(Arg) A34 adenosine deaminase TadA
MREGARLARAAVDGMLCGMDPRDDERLLREAIALACGSAAGDGGPFGAVVARDGVVVARGTNRVTADHDPTAHAEVVALRAAARALGTHDLTGCVLYASCEPCPMCRGAAQWARVAEVVYAADRAEAAAAGFDDRRFHDELARPARERTPPTRRLLAAEARAPFEAWAANPRRRPY